jgi:hypothetical protein
MHVLLDECVPHRLRHELPGHDVTTVQYRGWAGIRNGELLRRMQAAGIGALVTRDGRLPNQNNLVALGIAVIVLVAPSNDVAVLLPLMPAAMQALEQIKPGDVIRITVP